MKKTAQLGFLGGILCVAWLVAGCASSKYYAVTDSATGKCYYTARVAKNRQTGTVTFVDVVSGVEMTVPKPQVKPINREAFNQAVFK